MIDRRDQHLKRAFVIMRRRRDVLDIARTTVQLVDLGDIDVKAHDPEAHLAEAQDQR
jgi:hypothetical protein